MPWPFSPTEHTINGMFEDTAAPWGSFQTGFAGTNIQNQHTDNNGVVYTVTLNANMYACQGGYASGVYGDYSDVGGGSVLGVEQYGHADVPYSSLYQRVADLHSAKHQSLTNGAPWGVVNFGYFGGTNGVYKGGPGNWANFRLFALGNQNDGVTCDQNSNTIQGTGTGLPSGVSNNSPAQPGDIHTHISFGDSADDWDASPSN